MPREFKEPVVNFGFRHPAEDALPGAPQPVEPVPEPVSERFRAKADQWKRELLDVTRRNRAIHYRSTRALALPAGPEDLFEQMVTLDGEMSFSARNFAPDAANPAEDDRATAAFAAAAGLVDRARLADREQGIQVLFVALGWLRWVDPDGHELRSPLVLAPVDLAYDRQAKEVRLQAAADDPAEVNPSLTYLLASQLGLRLPKLEDAAGEPAFPTLAAFLDHVREVVKQQPGWTVEVDGPVVDVFAFAKLAMVDEIDRRLAELATHPILRALAGEDALPEVPEAPEESIDRQVAPGAMRLVVDADAYQLQAVAMAATGSSLVIEGPPGTGKSQTITNIISELLAQRKRVLFVAEKRVAREVVLDNLREAGLVEAVLHLASNAGATNRADAKAQVIKEIVGTLDAGSLPPKPEAALPARYGELRQRLNAYADGLAQPLGAEGWTNAYEVTSRAIHLTADFREGVPVPPIADRSRFWLDDVTDAAKELDAFAPDDLALLAGPWVHFAPPAEARDLEPRLRAALETLTSAGETVEQLLAPVLVPAHSLASGHTVAELETLARRLADVGEYRRRSRSFLRFVSPGFYGARADFQRYLEAGYRETGTEGETGEQLAAAVREAKAALATCAESFGPNAPADAAVGDVSRWAAALLPGMDRLGALSGMAAGLGRLEPLGMREAFATLLADPATHRRLAAVVPATVYGAWARQLATGELARTPDQHDRLVESFARLDSEMIGWGRGNVLYTVRDGRPRSANHPSMAALVKYAHAKRRPALRTMLGNSREAVQMLKPCLLMSPLAAAQYLCHGDGRTYRFDAVIVDEASMIPTPDLVVALSLAPQAIIVGDSKQMPPTSFFTKEISAASDDDDEVTFESILDEAAPLLPSTMLRAHYRSRDEALIAFSNAYFYDGRLIAFPDAWGERPDSGVQFQFVSDGVYGRGKSRANPAEAKRVIDLLREELANGPAGRQLSVTAMSLAQQSEILEQLEVAAALDPVVRGWMESGGLVRNLETVQGDESDVMFLSVGYGKDAEGRMFMNFGPLGQEKGERRLNVAITRARWKTVLVTSLHAGDIDPARASSTGALRLRDYLDYAERGSAALPAIEATAASGGMGLFPAVLLEVLRGQGLDCEVRVGVGGYQVDIGVRHPTDRERFVLAVECDGPVYYAAPSARDRELGRKAALERMGWNVHRVFAPAWLRNPDAELERLLTRYRQALL